MSQFLKVQMRKAEGGLVRLLGQIGRRGYDVLSVNAALTPDRTVWYVTVEFEPIVPIPVATKPAMPARPPEVLPALVAKLIDVVKVELVGSTAAKAPPVEPPKAVGGEMKWEE